MTSACWVSRVAGQKGVQASRATVGMLNPEDRRTVSKVLGEFVSEGARRTIEADVGQPHVWGCEGLAVPRLRAEVCAERAIQREVAQ